MELLGPEREEKKIEKNGPILVKGIGIGRGRWDLRVFCFYFLFVFVVVAF